MSTQLTKGGIHKIFNETNVESLIFEVLTIKYIHSGNRDYFHLKLSDGTHSSSRCMVGTQLKWVTKTLRPKSKIRVNRYVCKNISENKKVAIILDLDVLHSEGEDYGITGNPSPHKTTLSQRRVSSSTVSNSSQEILMETPTEEFVTPSNDSQQDPMNTSTEEFDQFASINSQNSMEDMFADDYGDERVTSNASQRSQHSSGESSGSSGNNIDPISSLTSEDKRWVIRARVTDKSKITPYDNGIGEGVRFFFDLRDQSGEIRAFAFNDECEKFYNMIKLNRVYDITQPRVKDSDKRYNPLNHDYEINFNYRTRVRLCQTETNIPINREYQFVNLNELHDFEPGSLIEVIGICLEIGGLSTINSSQSGKEVQKRNIKISDISGDAQVTLWEHHAESFEAPLESVITVKGARVSDFGESGRSLTVTASSVLEINPDIAEARNLLEQYRF